MKNFRCSFLSLLCFITVINTQAHSVWIEDNSNGELVIRFAEPDGKFEKSPGHLDSLTHPVAWKMVPTATNTEPSAFEVEKKKDHFLLVKSAKSDSAQTETAFQVMVHPGKPGRRPNFYARWQPQGGGAAAPALMLDIVPTGKAGEARAYFRGKPFGNAKARLRTPDEKEQDVVADADGFFKFPTEQSGFYLLSIAHHREPLPGFAGGKAYELFSHNASLSWRQ